MTSSNWNIFRVTGHLCEEFTSDQWIPHTKARDAELWCFFDLRLNRRLRKQWWGWWFEMPSHPLWLHCKELLFFSVGDITLSLPYSNTLSVHSSNQADIVIIKYSVHSIRLCKFRCIALYISSFIFHLGVLWLGYDDLEALSAWTFVKILSEISSLTHVQCLCETNTFLRE